VTEVSKVLIKAFKGETGSLIRISPLKLSPPGRPAGSLLKTMSSNPTKSLASIYLNTDLSTFDFTPEDQLKQNKLFDQKHLSTFTGDIFNRCLKRTKLD
jgi:hypothetical protein